MAAARLNLVIEKGAKFTKRLTWQDSAKAPISLAVYEARMQIRDTIDSTAFEVELTSLGGDIVLEAAAVTGQIDITIGAVATDAVSFTQGVYDLELYNPSDVDDVIRLVGGAVEVIGGVTR